MPEETVTTTTETTDVTPEVNTATETATAETQDVDVSSDNTEVENKTAGSEETETKQLPEALKDVPEGFIKKFGEIDLDNPVNANLVKSAYHSEKAMNEANNKLKELEKSQTEQKFTQETQQVSQGMQTLNNQYQEVLANYQAQGNQTISQALSDAQEGLIDLTAYAQIVAQENEKWLANKAQADSIYSESAKQLKGKEAELSQQRISNSFKEFENTQSDKLAKPEYKAIYDCYKSKGYDPQDAGVAFEIFETGLQTYLKSEASKKAITSGVEADKSAMTTTVGKGGSITSKPMGLDDLAAMSDSAYKAYLKKTKAI